MVETTPTPITMRFMYANGVIIPVVFADAKQIDTAIYRIRQDDKDGLAHANFQAINGTVSIALNYIAAEPFVK